MSAYRTAVVAIATETRLRPRWRRWLCKIGLHDATLVEGSYYVTWFRNTYFQLERRWEERCPCGAHWKCRWEWVREFTFKERV